VKIDFGFTTTTLEPITLPVELRFTATVTDADGDQAISSFGVTTTSGATIVGTDQADVLSGSAASENLWGGAGADVFRWSLSDQGSTSAPATDVIKDFKLAEGDQLDFRDLLGTAESPASLDAYLRFSELTPGGHVVIEVDPDGTGAGGITQKVVLEGVKLDDIKALSPGSLTYTAGNLDQELIAKLLATNHLKTDNTP
jgi:hypothetical protein